ncbi:MAG: transposase [Planctomycetes bacterium]|nr:transposase [Planctomycetota bacterium]
MASGGCPPEATRSGICLLLIATNLFDLPAWIIALIYRYRWTIEVFFRFFKHVLGCRHLLSRDQAGIEIQTYCAIIACMLISLWTGRKPTLRTYEMICHYFSGLAEEDELLAHLAKLQAHQV